MPFRLRSSSGCEDTGSPLPWSRQTPGTGKTTMRAKLDEADAAKLDLSADAVQAELQAVLEAAIH